MPKKFDFISPGVQLNEIDESTLPAIVTDAGPVLIGRALSGPAMQPVIIKNYADFKSIFGEPVSGEGASDVDVWRDGNKVGPTYASYAAQAHLSSETTPITFIRLLGEANDQATADGQAGWDFGAAGSANTTISSNKTAYGLFVWASGSGTVNGTLGAVIYTNGAAVTLSGTIGGTADTTSSAGVMIKSHGNVANQFRIEIWESNSAPSVTKVCHFTDGSNNYIRNQLNTNPQKIEGNKNFGITNLKYFLGQTYEQSVADQTGGGTKAAQYGMILPLEDASGCNYHSHRGSKKPAKTGWFINRKPGEEQLFRLVSLHDGEWFQNNYELFIEDLKLGDRLTPSSFSVVLKDLSGTTVESWKGVNLDASSDSYIAKKIGNQTFSWNNTDLKYDVSGLYLNRSDYFYVEVSDAVANSTLDDTLALPMGFQGPLRPAKFNLLHGSKNANAGDDAVNSGVKATSTITTSTTAMEEDGTITFTGPDGAMVVTSTSGTGTDATFTAGAANIDRTEYTTYSGFANALATLLNSMNGYSAAVTPDGSTKVVTIVADQAGSHWTYTVGESGDTSGYIAIGAVTAGEDTDSMTYPTVLSASSVPLVHGDVDSDLFCVVPQGCVAHTIWPTFRLTETGTNRGGDYKRSDYYGIRHIKGSGTNRDSSYADITYPLPMKYGGGYDHHTTTAGTYHERAFVFHLEDIKVSSTDTTRFYLESGSYASADASNLSYNGASGTTGVAYLCGTKKIKQYRAAFWGGYDGLNIKEVEPFSNKNLKDKAAVSDYAYNSVVKAFDIVRDPEVVEMDMIAMPGLTRPDLTLDLLELATERGDALAVIDLEAGYLPKWENSGEVSYGTINSTLSTLESRQLNNSYGACYYPWVVIRDSNNDVLAVPSSVAAIGALAKSAADSEVWFAPAGFNRGGIKNLGSNNSGLIVTHTIEHLTKDNRDDLYSLNVNPIARFPATNQIVIFGQKALQQTASALDRINVRRLLLFLKRRIGKIADTILFEPNVETTWSNFKSAADAVLSDVQAKLGITEYKLVLDTTTTTADLIDRNIMYAKIFIKPARAIEFIVVDFVVTRSGVEF